jgi:hypothetical protein
MKTQDELSAIKAELALKHKPLYTITVPLNDDDTEFATIFLKKFDRLTLSAIQKAASGTDPLKSTEIFLRNTFVGGDSIDLIISNLDALRAVESVMLDLVSAKKAVLSKN